MAGRAIWRAELRVGPRKLPVKLYPAVRDAAVRFRLLETHNQAPVKQEMVEPGDDRPVPREAVQRGLEVDEGTLVILREEELRELEPPASREILLEEFVDPATVDLRWFERPYYLGPDGDEPGYFALVEALQSRDRIGIARWVMRRKRYQGALHTSRGYLILTTLRHAEQLVHVEAIRPPADREPDQRELALAGQLVAALEDRFDPAAYRDEYRERVRQLVEAKAKGLRIRRPRPRAVKPRGGSLADTLAASLRAAKKRAHG